MKKKEDLRVIKTKTNLYNALLELMKESPFEEIKVSDICAKSLINRSTFYDHFSDKYELFQSLIEDLEKELKNNLVIENKVLTIKEYYLEICKLLLEHIEEYISTYSYIVKNNSNSIVNDMLRETTIKFVTEYIDNNYDNFSNIPTYTLVLFYVSGLINVCFNEMKNEKTFNKENILIYFESLIPDFGFIKPKNKNVA